MNFNIINTSLVVVGAILIYCGIKNITPKQALQEILTGSKANTPVADDSGTGSTADAFGKNKTNDKSGSGGGGGGSGSW